MNYEKIYNQLIEKRKKYPLVKNKKMPNYVYCETHHIIPKFAKGTNDKNNLINLTYREHYFAHLILVKYYKQINNKNLLYKAKRALQAFQNLNYGTIRNEIFLHHIYIKL